MIPGLEALACQDLAVPMAVMEHVVRVESAFNPYAIGVVGARLARQPNTLEEAVATAASLERDGYNFSLGLAQVNRHNLEAQGLLSYEEAFSACPNLRAGARILADCHARAAGNWDKAFSCYYSGNFERGFRDGYVARIHASMAAEGAAGKPPAPAADALRRRRARPEVPGPPGVAVGPAQPGPVRDLQVDSSSGQRVTRTDGPYVPRVIGPSDGPAAPDHAAHAAGSRDGPDDPAFVF